MEDRLKSMKGILLDVDGVLTDGTIWYDDSGREWKGFSSKDGLMIKAIARLDLPIGIITGRESSMVERRGSELGIRWIRQGIEDKSDALRAFVTEYNLEEETIIYIGDDLNDWRAMKLAGFTACPADAGADIRDRVDWVLETRGGRGVVRELGEAWLKALGLWDKILAEHGVQDSSPGPSSGRRGSDLGTDEQRRLARKHRARLKEFRKSLRNKMTPAESRLWEMLKQRQLDGLKFRRQHSIENMIVDFYCPEKKLVIELDGAYHFTPEGEVSDAMRDDRLAELGYQVIRFENKEIFEHSDLVVETIKQATKK